MEAVAGISTIATLVEQSFGLLERIQMALEHNKAYAMHLTIVARDIESIKSIMQQVKDDSSLQTDLIGPTMKDILDLANKLNDLITKQEANTKTGAGFRTFAHSFAKGPKEQKQLEELKGEIIRYKNTLVLCIVAGLAPSGTVLDVKGVTMDGVDIMQNSRIIREPGDKDFDRITIREVDMKGASFMNNSAVTPDQQNWVLNEQSQRAKRERLLQFIARPGVDEDLKKQIIDSICQ